MKQFVIIIIDLLMVALLTGLFTISSTAYYNYLDQIDLASEITVATAQEAQRVGDLLQSYLISLITYFVVLAILTLVIVSLFQSVVNTVALEEKFDFLIFVKHLLLYLIFGSVFFSLAFLVSTISIGLLSTGLLAILMIVFFYITVIFSVYLTKEPLKKGIVDSVKRMISIKTLILPFTAVIIGTLSVFFVQRFFVDMFEFIGILLVVTFFSYARLYLYPIIVK